MKTNTEIICSIVPRGIDEKNQYHFSLFLTPRLYQTGTLRLYDEIKQWNLYRDFFSNNQLLRVKFGTLDDSNGPMTITPQGLLQNVTYKEDMYKAITSRLSAAGKEVVVWEQLFDATTPVKGWAEHQEVTSESLSPLYQTRTSASSERSFHDTSDAKNIESIAKRLARSDNFEDIRKKSLTSDELISNKENQEFHTKISILADYPHILRLLGWIYDFSLQLTNDEEVKTAFSQCNLIKFMIDGFEPIQKPDTTDINLWNNFTNYVTFITPWTYFDSGNFNMKYKETLSEGNPYYLVNNGFLKSKSDGYEINASQIDLKRIIQKYLETEGQNGINEFGTTNSLSSTGIALVVQNSPNQKLPLESAVNAKPAPATLDDPFASDDEIANNKANDNYVLFGHHLDTGYRIDVVTIERVREVVENQGTAEETKSYSYTYKMQGSDFDFYSLCRRISDYLIDKGKGKQEEHLLLVENFEDEPWVAESAQIGASGKLYYDVELCRWNNWSLTCPPLGDYPQDEGEEVGDKFYNDLELRNIKPVLGSLLPLRFGKRYAFRVRIVDICGNSKALKDPSPLNAEGQLDPDYLIYSDGAYKRFELVNPPGIYFGNSDNKWDNLETIVLKTTVEEDKLIYTQDCIRLVAPPKANLQFIESHGVIDGLLKQKAGRNKVYERAAFLPANPEIYVHNSIIPFLTDPVCQGFTLTVKSFSTDNNNERFIGWKNSGADLLQRQFVTLRIAGEKVEEEELEQSEDGITITLKPGAIYEAFLQSEINVNPNEYNSTDYDAANSASPVNIFHHLLQEGNKNLTVPKKINLIHAVQKPVVRRKGENEVFYRPSYKLQLEVAERTPLESIPIKFSKMNFELIQEINARCFPISTSGEFILVASSYNIIIYYAEKAGFRKEVNKIQKSFSNLGEEGKLKLEDDYTADMFFNQFEGFEHSFGDSQFRRVQYTFMAVSRFREYFPEKKQEDLQVEGVVHREIIVNNASLPEAPVIHSIVPIFTWTRKGSTTAREQNTIRIYFEGTWYSSGPEEKVAILFLQDENSVDERYEGLVSEYGKDPATPGPATTGLKRDFFQSEKIVGRGGSDKIDYRLIGKRYSQDGSSVNSMAEPAPFDELLCGAVYEVGFDQEAKRFYSDVVLILNKQTTLYSPFLKLAVSRYQEHSIREPDQYDYRFSPVVMAPSIQLLPSRKISWKDLLSLKSFSAETSSSKPGNEIYIFLEKEFSSETTASGTPTGEMKILKWDARKNASIEGYDLATIEEYEHYEAGPPDFTMADGIDYNPRNDIRKRLIFSFQYKLEATKLPS